MTIIFNKDIINEIFEHAEKDNPIEACGYLVGTVSSDGKEYNIKAIYPMTNIEKSEEHFTLDTEEQFSVMKQAWDSGLEIIAVYHSHPKSPARPSKEDINSAYDPNIIYVIASLMNAKRTIKAFKINKGQVSSLKIKVSKE